MVAAHPGHGISGDRRFHRTDYIAEVRFLLYENLNFVFEPEELLEGLVIGGDPSKGFFDENWFVHPELAFVMGFPPGWNGINSAGFVGAQKPVEETFVMLALVGKGADPVDGAKAASKKLETDLASDAQLGILNGLKAARNQLQVSGENGQAQMLELTWIAHAGLIYQRGEGVSSG